MALFDLKKSLAKSGLLKGAADFHSHILYGVDDGVRDLADSLQVLDYLGQQGLADLWLTPHVMEDVPNTTDRLEKRFAELQKAYEGPISLHLGAEYMMDSLLMKRIDEGDILVMSDNMVLVETSTWRAPENWEYLLERIKSRGFQPLFAHVERYQYLKEEDYDRLHSMDIPMQLNLGSLTGFYGETARRKAQSLLAKGYYYCCGSDCHRLANLEKQYGSACLKKKELSALRSLLVR